jgi:addiction module RelB/DinJ family antitoxin
MPRQSVKTQMIHARIEPKLKMSAERIFSEIGMSTTEAIRLFL